MRKYVSDWQKSKMPAPFPGAGIALRAISHTATGERLYSRKYYEKTTNFS